MFNRLNFLKGGFRMSKYSYQDCVNENDLLKGNINRMFLTDDYSELVENYNVAVSRLNSIFLMHLSRVQQDNSLNNL